VTIKQAIESSLKEKQRGMRVRAGDQFWRGLDLITVKSVGSEVSFRDIRTGTDQELTRAEFFSRSLLRVPLGNTKKYDALKQIFKVISNKKLPQKQRVLLGKKYASMAKGIDDARIIRRWLVSLAQGEEPKGLRNV
jgi:hypothetical protein